jgi:hypothetical protein
LARWAFTSTTFALEAVWEAPRQQADVLSFDIVGPAAGLASVWQTLAFARRFLSAVFPQQTLSLCFEHRAIAHAYSKSHQRKKELRSLVSTIIRGDENPLRAELAEVQAKLIETFGADARRCTFRVRNLDPRMRLRVTVVGMGEPIAEITCFEKDVQVTSARVALGQLWGFCQTVNSFKQRRREVLFVIVFAPIDTHEIVRGQYDEAPYQEAFVEVQRIAGELRASGWAASVAPNDGQAVDAWRHEAAISFVGVIAVASFQDWRPGMRVVVRAMPTASAPQGKAATKIQKTAESEEEQLIGVLRKIDRVEIWSELASPPEKAPD